MLSRLLSITQFAIENPGALMAKLRGADAKPYGFMTRPWVQAMGINTAFDIGANVGRWSKACRLAMPNAFICAFEPIPSCQDAMRRKMQGDKRHQIFPCALGSSRGQMILNVHEHAASSSLLSENQAMKNINAKSTTIEKISVTIETLDHLKQSNDWAAPYFLKLDVQGFELEVLKGASNILSNTALIVAETSFKSLYERQAIFSDLHDYLNKARFQYFGAAESVLKTRGGLEVQQDSVFINTALIDKIP